MHNINCKNRKNHVNILLINDGEKWHYLAVKSLSAVLNRITSKHNRKSMSKSWEIPNEDNKLLKNNHGEKSVKAPFIIYVVLERLLKNEPLL